MATRLTPRTRAILRRSDLEVTLPRLAGSGGWAGVFGVDSEPPLPVTLELGTGKDPHLIERAARSPDRLFVGLEHSKKKLDKVHAKAIRRRIRNLRLLRADVFRVLDRVFADDSLEGAYVLFPDPWPKKRHHKKRMVQHSLMDQLARKLRAGAHLELRTDHAEYRDQMVRVLDSHPSYENLLPAPGFALAPHPESEHIPTLFETKFRGRGLTIHYLYYRKIDHADVPPPRTPYPVETLVDYDPLKSSADDPLPQEDDSE